MQFTSKLENFMKLFELKKARETALAKADSIVAAAEKAERLLTPAENAELDSAMAEVNTLNPQIRVLEGANTIRKIDPVLLMGGGRPGGRTETPGRVDPGNMDQRFGFPEVGEFLRTREPGILAALTEGGELQFVIPGYQVDQFLVAYPGIDVWTQAGARVTDLEGGWINQHQPIIVSGPDVGVFAEGTGPTVDQSATVYVAKLDSPKKHAFLSLPSEEAYADVAQLGGSLAQEGIRRTIFSIGKSVTAAFVASLTAAHATVPNTGDGLTDLLNLMEAGPDGIFSQPTNKWMLNRRTLAAVRNIRTSGDVAIPISVYNPSANQILGFDIVRNSALPNGVILFGDFNSAVYLRRAGLAFMLLNQTYLSEGAIGLRFTKRADWAFFADAATAAQAEQPVYMLEGGADVGS
jgi:hypothetical protein